MYFYRMLRRFFFVLIFIQFSDFAYSQSIQVDQDRYTAQQLIEEILIQSDCITDVVVTNVSGANFTDGSKSFGYFDANGTNFPITNGLVLSTGKLNTIPQPTANLANDYHAGWNGDPELEAALDIDSYNATIIEFDFVPNVSGISFRYLFASEEFQSDNSLTCSFSDAFAFFIRKVDETTYENLAVVPGTQIPIQNTTVHPYISDDCPATNEAYFDRFNFDAETIFDGQTKVLNAVANVTPGETYHVKLVIADDLNDKYDSAVFLEAGSFQSNADLGPDRLIQNNDAICYSEDLLLQPASSAGDQLKWYKNGEILTGETTDQLLVSSPGEYSVEITSAEGCVAQGTAFIEFYPEIDANAAQLSACGFSDTEIANFNLLESASQILNPSQRTTVEEFYLNEEDALNGVNQISNPENFSSSPATIYGTVHDGFGCSKLASISLDIQTEIVFEPYQFCTSASNDELEIEELKNLITVQFSEMSSIEFYLTKDDALSGSEEIQTTINLSDVEQQKLYVKIIQDDTCTGFAILPFLKENIAEVGADLNLNLCENSGEQVQLESGVEPDSSEVYSYTWFFEDSVLPETTESIFVSQTGNYRVEIANSNGCVNLRNFTVDTVEPAIIVDVNIQNSGNNYQVTIEIAGNGNYEFALDSTDEFQQSPNFTNVPSGIHTVYVRDESACNLISQEIAIFGYDRFLTPNGDGINDTWKINGITSDYSIQIFNRYGKLIATLNQQNPVWNGRFNNIELPAGEYWFKLIQDNKVTLSGHFSLIR